MKDFPVFTTEYGVASLILKEIPYKGVAYIFIRSSQQPEELLQECVSFCRICGAERIYATGHEELLKYPLHSVIYEMRGEAVTDEGMVENLWPVTAETVGRWREIYNRRMRAVDNASTLEASDEKRITESGGAYFVHEKGQLLGIGWMEQGEVKAVASEVPGAGVRIMHTLMSVIPEEQVHLQVVSTNHRAIRLYEKLGFVKTAEISRWYRIV